MADPSAAPAAESVYRPLSLLAIAAFVVGGVYAAAIALYSATALYQGTPLLLGFWALLVPVVGTLLAVIAWRQIQASEGTRAGGALAVWGGFLCLLCGLLYGAYFTATYFVLKNQAERFGQEWLSLLTHGEDKGNVEKAFWFTLRPEQRQGEDPANLDRMEVRHNMVETPGGRGPLSMFRQNDLVRLLRQAGPDARIEPRGVLDWGLKDGAYIMTLGFHVATSLGTSEALLTVFGKESQSKDTTGRQWWVDFFQSGLRRGAGSLTEEGQKLLETQNQGRMFAQRWSERLSTGQTDEAYLDTKPPAERERLRAEYRKGLLLPWLDPETARELYLPGYRAFKEGELIGTPDFWALEPARTQVPALARAMFRQPQFLGSHLRPETATLSLYRKDQGRLQVQFDYQLMVPPAYSVESVLIVESDANAPAGQNTDASWRIAGLELSRARKVTASPGGPGGPMR